MTNVLIRRSLLPADLAWIDHTGVSNAAFLAAPGSERGTILETLFWNRSVEHVLLLPGARPPDKFAAPRLALAPNGSLLLAGHPVEQPLVLDNSATTVLLQNAHQIVRAGPLSLWRPARDARLSLLMWDRLADGTLLPAGGIWLWTHGQPAAGWVTFRVRPARADTPGSFELYDHNRRTFAATLHPHRTLAIRLPFCGGERWARGFQGQNAATSPPRYMPDPRACP
jgi:hypothetical protein